MSAPKGISLGSIVLATVLRMEAWWLLLITASMPMGPRDRYREELRSHLLDHLEDDQVLGRGSLKSALRISLRFVAGVPADIAACARQSRLLLEDRSKGPAKRFVLIVGMTLAAAALCAIAKLSGHPELWFVVVGLRVALLLGRKKWHSVGSGFPRPMDATRHRPRS